MVTDWTYRFHDLLTDQFIEELPLANVDFQRMLASAGPGNFTADLFLGDRNIRDGKNWRDATEARGSVVYSWLRDVPIACHLVWDTLDDLKAQKRQLSGAELWSYFHHRIITYDRTYGKWDQLDIVRDLLRQEFREPNGDIRVQVEPVGTHPLSGVVRVSTVYDGSAGKDLAAAVEEQAQLVDGFDFDITVHFEAGVPVRRFATGFPRLGVDNSPLPEFTYPGNIAEGLQWPRAGSAAVNRAVALGMNRLRQDWADPESFEQGFALLEAARNYHTTNDVNTLLRYAKADLAAQRWPPNPIAPPVRARPATPSSWRRSTKPASVPAIPLRLDLVDLAAIASRIGDSVSVHIEDDAFFPSLGSDGLDHRVMDRYWLVGLHCQPDKGVAELLLNSLDGLDARLAVTS